MKLNLFTITICLYSALALGACAVLAPAQTSTPTAATATTTPEVAATEPSPSQTQTILLWLAPAFAPGTTAGELLSARLRSFESQNPGVRINTRIKQVSGPGGLLDTLEAASVAAPAVIPDLLTLPADDLHRASELGLIVPLPDQLIQAEDQGWYDYALPPSRFNGLFYGLPFASEVEILAYRLDQYPEPPRSWEVILSDPRTLLFPAADPRARFILSMYLGAGGELSGADGEPQLDVAVLESVLSLLASARSSSVLPLAVRQYSSPLETWTELKANRSASAMAPMADFLREGDTEMLAAVALPTESGQGIGLALTWSMAITAPDPTRQQLLFSLLSWLSDPQFAGSLTNALGYLPTSQDVLAAWPDDSSSALASRLVTITQAEPGHSTRDAVAPALLAAIEAVLGAGQEPLLAAQAAADLVNNR